MSFSSPVAPVPEGSRSEVTVATANVTSGISTSDTSLWAEDEWSPLKEVIVGRLEGFAIPANHPAVRASVPEELAQLLPVEGGKPLPTDLVQRAQEELDAFIRALEAEGVRIHRPSLPANGTDVVIGPDASWKSTQMGTACVRDSVLIVGRHIIEAPQSWRCRYEETRPLQDLFRMLVSRKPLTQWTVAPRPTLADSVFDVPSSDSSPITDEEPLFEAADFVRCGRFLFGQLSNGTNPSGVAWLRAHLGDEYEIHIVEQKCAKPLHIDCTIVPLGPRTLLLNPAYIDLKMLPESIRQDPSWRILIGPPPSPVKPSRQASDFTRYNMCSPNLAYNLLTLSPHCCVVDETQPELIALLESEGIRCIPLACQHLSPFGGSFHCFTLDLVRTPLTAKEIEVTAQQ